MSDTANLDKRVTVLETIAIDTKSAIDRIDRRLERMEGRIDTIQTTLHEQYNRLLLAIIGSFGGLLAALILQHFLK